MEKKGPHAIPAFILGCMASCYSNVTSHSFSPAVFDQFSLFASPSPTFLCPEMPHHCGWLTSAVLEKAAADSNPPLIERALSVWQHHSYRDNQTPS